MIKQDYFLSPKGILVEKLGVDSAIELIGELQDYMQHNGVVIAIVDNELTFARLANNVEIDG